MSNIGYVATLEKIRLEIVALRESRTGLISSPEDTNNKIQYLLDRVVLLEAQMNKLEDWYFDINEPGYEELKK